MDVHILLWIGLFLSAFFILLLITKKDKITSDWFLMSWLAVSGIHLSFYIHNLYNYSRDYEWVYRLGFSLSLVHAPLLFLYVCACTGVQKWFFSKFYIHFIPYFIFSFVIGVLLSGDNIGIVRYGYLVWLTTPPFMFQFYGLVLAVSGMAYPAWSYMILLHYQREVMPGFFSNEARINLNWLKYWVVASSVYFIVVFSLVVLSIDFGLIQSQTIFKWVASALVLHLVYIGFFGLKQNAVFTTFPEVSQNKLVPRKISPVVQLEQAEKLIQIMSQNKPYLIPDLTLPMLASQAGMSTHDLSSLINDHFGVNFYKFINGYRVDEFKQQVQKPENVNLKILAIAYASGFNSKSTFNKVFMELTGVSPSEFRREPKTDNL